MGRFMNAAFGPRESNLVSVSRIGMAVVLGLVLAIHGMILAI